LAIDLSPGGYKLAARPSVYLFSVGHFHAWR